ncbi:MAG: hypothetical protein ABL950_04865 [Nitrospira sp.]
MIANANIRTDRIGLSQRTWWGVTHIMVVFAMGISVNGCGSDDNNSALAQGAGRPFVAPIVFQAAGPDLTSIQGTIEQYRMALGATNNGNNPGPLADGRREINWDGGNPSNTTVSAVGTPFNGFQVTRGALFTTAGTGFVQAPVAGLATTFTNPTYETIFQTFSPQRLFSPINSNVTEALFFVPGPGAETKPATTRGFGAVFTDIDQPNGSSADYLNGNRKPSTIVEYFDTTGASIYTSSVPASPGDKSMSFLGIVFTDARIAKVKITSGDTAPGPNDDGTHDIVMMDDFFFGEPQPRL